VLSGSERRFRPLAFGTVKDVGSLRLIHVPRPYRLDWATRGLTPDGWTISGRAATLRFYGQGNPGRRRVSIVLSASRRAALPVDFTIRGEGQLRSGWVDPGGARPPVRFNLCLPARGFVDLTLASQGEVGIPDGRLVGVHVDDMWTSPEGACGRAQVSSR
jgi:hypothetical protein